VTGIEDADTSDVEAIKRHARKALGAFVSERTKRRPMIVPVVMEA
jgi:ribonuclease J